jgi:hypothetical protein
MEFVFKDKTLLLVTRKILWSDGAVVLSRKLLEFVAFKVFESCSVVVGYQRLGGP